MYIHDHHGRFESRCKENRFFAVDGFSDDLEVVIALDNFAQNPPNERMVIHQQDLDGLEYDASLSSLGM